MPHLRPVVLPLVYLNTHIHELCHALTAVLTGGEAQRILVFADGSGLAPVRGGSILLVASAGYTGAAIIGGLLIAGARTPETARRMLWLTFGFLLFSMVFFVRGDLIGIMSGLFWLAALAAAAWWLRGVQLTFAAQFLGLQQCLTSLQAFLALFTLTATTEVQSDARILEGLSGVPAIAWASGWLVVSILCVGTSLKRAWAPASPRP